MNTYRNRWYILQIVNVGTFMLTLDVGVANIALPTLSAEFGVPLAHAQWFVTSYLLAMVALLPILGRISDRSNRSFIYSAGFLVFTLSSLLIAISAGFAALIIFRCMQGFGAAMLLANSQAVVRQIFPEHERGKALGINAVVISIGTLTGPAIGGAIMEVADWPMLFLMNIPFGLVAFFLGWRWFPRDQGRTVQRVDWIGSVLLTAGAVLLLLAGAGIELAGFTPLSVSQLLLGVVLLVGLVIFDARIDYGIIDPVLYRNRAILLGNVSSFLLNLVQMAIMIALTFYMQRALGFSMFKMGAVLAIQPLLMGVTAPLAGWYRDKYGAAAPLAVGALLCTAGLLFICLGREITTVDLALQFGLFGIGMGLFHATNNVEIMSAAPDGKISLVGSMLALIRNLGLIFGTGLATLFVGAVGVAGEGGQNAVDYANGMTAPVQLLSAICFAIGAVVVVLGVYRLRAKLFIKLDS